MIEVTTHILLDIDGVINAIYPTQAHKELSDLSGEWRDSFINGFWFNWNTEVIDYINDLTENHHLVILSTWRKTAIEDVFPVVGLNVPETYVVLDPDTDSTSFTSPDAENWWKEVHAKEFIESHSDDSFVWIDDDHANVRVDTSLWSDNVLIVSPNQRTGISLLDMQSINEFISAEVDNPA